VLTSVGKKLSQLREEAQDYLVGNGMAVPKPLLWGKNNNPEEWWSVNDFEIFCASYTQSRRIFKNCFTLLSQRIKI
jgi:hypothetical protein